MYVFIRTPANTPTGRDRSPRSRVLRAPPTRLEEEAVLAVLCRVARAVAEKPASYLAMSGERATPFT